MIAVLSEEVSHDARQKSQQRGAHHDLGRYAPRRPPKNCKKQNREEKAARETPKQNPRSTATAVKDKCRAWKKRINHATVLKKLCVFYCSYFSLSLRKFSTWVVKLRKEGIDDVDERRMTEKDSLSLSRSVVSFEMGFFIEGGVDSGGESSWTLIFGEAILGQFFSGGFFSPLVCSRIFPSFRRDVCFSWVCIVISGMCFSYIGGWKSY